MDKKSTMRYIRSKWDEWLVAGISDFVRVPNLTTLVDKEYLTNGLLEKAAEVVD
jgi:hypothetical protein